MLIILKYPAVISDWMFDTSDFYQYIEAELWLIINSWSFFFTKNWNSPSRWSEILPCIWPDWDSWMCPSLEPTVLLVYAVRHDTTQSPCLQSFAATAATTSTFIWRPFLQMDLGQPVLSSTCSGRESLEISGTDFFTGRMSFISRNNQCQSTEWNAKPGLILSSSTTVLLTEGALLPLWLALWLVPVVFSHRWWLWSPCVQSRKVFILWFLSIFCLFSLA